VRNACEAVEEACGSAAALRARKTTAHDERPRRAISVSVLPGA